jgi:7-carboxy-7-deazaguanine synthase
MTATATISRHAKTKTFPVIEIFGPTIQGEGAEAGVPTHFVRFGGCDYRCTWCDTMYAVDPAIVRDTARALSSERIATEIEALPGRPNWITLSGGNPALHDLHAVVQTLQSEAYRVAVETQGSVWKNWLSDVDRLTISPKPPSSGMVTSKNDAQLDRFMERVIASNVDHSIFKVVCFDQTDLNWAKKTVERWPGLPLYLSAGTPVPSPGPVRDAVGDRYRWLCEAVAADPDLSEARVLPQLHVIAWEEATGV